jgi:hypothetical protein
MWLRKSSVRSSLNAATLFCMASPCAEPPVVFNEDPDTVNHCLDIRAFATPDNVDETAFAEFSMFVTEDLPKLFPSWASRTGVFEPTPFESWNDRFPGPKAKRHRAALADLAQRPLTDQDYRKDGFLKVEITHNKDKPARLIQSSSDRVKVIIGPYLHHLSKIVGTQLGGKAAQGVVYAPGKNALALGQFYNSDENAVGTDMSRFDSCVTERYMLFMLEVYKFFLFPPHVLSILKESIRGPTTFRSGLVVQPYEYRRTSGHCNTTVENTLLNLFLHRWAIARTGKDLTGVRFMVGGDDVLIQGHDTLEFCDDLRLLGFRPKPQVFAPGRASFYSSIFLPTTAGVVLTPKIGRFLMKFGWSAVQQARPTQWIRDVCQCDLHVFAHLPFMVSLIDSVIVASGVPASDQVPVRRTYGSVLCSESPETMAALMVYYNCGMDVFYGISQRFVGKRLGSLVNLPLLADLLLSE